MTIMQKKTKFSKTVLKVHTVMALNKDSFLHNHAWPLKGQSLWLFRWWEVLPHHLHFLPPRSTSAPAEAGTGFSTGARGAVPLAMAVSVTAVAMSSLTASSSSSP